MKKALLLLSFFAILFSATAEEKILTYHSDIKINKDRTVDITESIKVKVEGLVFRRGIYRSIPTSYEIEGGVYRIGFDVLEITKNGQQEPYHIKRQNNGQTIYLGSKNKYLKEGIYDYTIKYKVDHVLNLYENFDELAWNINGPDWNVKIDKISATVHFPGMAKTVQNAVYTGAYGSKKNDAVITNKQNIVEFVGKNPLSPGEEMTIATAWDKGFLTYPNEFDKLMFKLKTYSLWGVGGVGVLLTLLVNFFMWRREGKDPAQGIIIPQFSAPEGMTPADCAYIDNYWKYTKRAFVSTMVNLGVTKQMKIEDEVEKEYVFVNRQKYTLTKTPGNKITNPQLERNFLNSLFGNTNIQTIVRKKYNANIKAADTSLRGELAGKHKGVHICRNHALTFKSLIIPALAVIAGIFCFNRYGGSFGIVILMIAILFAITFVFAHWFQRPTKEGSKLMDHVRGMKQYIKLTEEERLKIVNPPDFSFTHFEKMLPYAIALDCADEWQHQFEVVNPQVAQQHQSFMWYGGNNVGGYSDFDFGDMNDTISSASIPPTKSSGGGSMGGGWSGGGGFSGGGFGGGGGGGW